MIERSPPAISSGDTCGDGNATCESLNTANPDARLYFRLSWGSELRPSAQEIAEHIGVKTPAGKAADPQEYAKRPKGPASGQQAEAFTE